MTARRIVGAFVILWIVGRVVGLVLAVSWSPEGEPVAAEGEP